MKFPLFLSVLFFSRQKHQTRTLIISNLSQERKREKKQCTNCAIDKSPGPLMEKGESSSVSLGLVISIRQDPWNYYGLMAAPLTKSINEGGVSAVSGQRLNFRLLHVLPSSSSFLFLSSRFPFRFFSFFLYLFTLLSLIVSAMVFNGHNLISRYI